MSFLNLIGTDCMNIISEYKTEMENYEKQYKKIDELVATAEDVETIQVYISYSDLKEYLFRRNITYVKFQIGIYGKNHPNNTKFWDLDLIREDDTFLEDFNILEIAFGTYMNRMYLKFEGLVDPEDITLNSSDDEDFDIEMDSDDEDEDSDDEDIDWNDLV